MAAFQPIEDAGPRLAFGVIHFLRVFVAAALPGVVEETPQGPRRSLNFSSLLKRTPGQGWNDGFQEPLLKTKTFQEMFDWMDLKPEPESEQGFRGQEVLVAGTGSSVDLVSKLVLSFPGMPAEEDFEVSGSISHPDHPSVT